MEHQHTCIVCRAKYDCWIDACEFWLYNPGQLFCYECWFD